MVLLPSFMGAIAVALIFSSGNCLWDCKSGVNAIAKKKSRSLHLEVFCWLKQLGNQGPSGRPVLRKMVAFKWGAKADGAAGPVIDLKARFQGFIAIRVHGAWKCVEYIEYLLGIENSKVFLAAPPQFHVNRCQSCKNEHV